MEKYNILVKLVFENIVEVEADDIDEAKEIAADMYDPEDIICNWDNQIETYEW